VAEKLDDISVSEEEFDSEASSVPEATGGEASTKAKVAPPSGGGGRSAKPRGATPGFFARTGQYFRDTRAEMRRVSWPTATEVKNTTIITLVAVVFFAIYLFGVDRVWAFLIDHLRVWLGGT
jgi:preprotein translocase subunit SecE